MHACSGPVEAHHARPRGLGQRAADSTCIPLCRAAHRSWHDGGPPFGFLTRDQRRAWAEAHIALLNAEWAGVVVATTREGAA
jgi:hypothetical protein